MKSGSRGWLPAVLIVMALHASAPASRAQPRTVLAVHWSSEDFSGTPRIDAAIRDALRAGPSADIAYFAEYLESDLFPDEEATLAFRDYIQRKYRGRRIDVVVANADPAVQFVLKHREQLFPDAAVVYISVTEPLVPAGASGLRLTGVRVIQSNAETLDMALRLHPATTNVLVVAYARSDHYLDFVQTQLAPFADRVTLTYFSGGSVDALGSAIDQLPPRSLVLYIRFSQDDPADLLLPIDGARLVADRARVPVYGIVDSFIGTGIVGGVVRPQAAVGEEAGRLARRILDGESVQGIGVVEARRVPAFDWRQLRRWGIADSALPAGSIVQYREISVFEQYRGAILATAGVLVLQSLLIAALVLEHRRRRRAEVESRRNLAAMAHLDRRAAMGELATSLAHELNQPLNAILQNAGVAQMLIARHPLPEALAEVPEIISDISKDDVRAAEVIRRMRGLLHKGELESHPVDLNDVAWETMAIVGPDATSRGVALETDLAGVVPAVHGDRVHLQQVLLNLLINAIDAVATEPVEHRRVRVSTSVHDGQVRLAVSDSGRGIPEEHLATIFEPFYTTKREGIGMGMGLAISRSIVEAHEGRIAAENNSAGGATVWLSLPARG
jgi:signal transduction histidine kinase